MSKFILVHDVPAGNPIVLHSDEVRVVTKSEMYGGSSAIRNYCEAEPFLHVAESPEKIFEMLKQ